MEHTRGLMSFTEQLQGVLDDVDRIHVTDSANYGADLANLNKLTVQIVDLFTNLAQKRETDCTFLAKPTRKKIRRASQ